MLPIVLNTNEVKNSANQEQEFERILTEGRKSVYKLILEQYNLPKRLTVQHAESGVGFKLVRRSNITVKLHFLSDVDNTTIVPITYSQSVTIPVGALVSTTPVKDTMAMGGSFVHLTGAGTTFLFDGTGIGSAAIRDGSL